MNKAPETNVEPLLLSIPDACKISGYGRSSLYERISSGEIEARKHGKRTLVVFTSLKASTDRLPTFKPSITKKAA